MGYLDSLKEIQQIAISSEDFNFAQRAILIDLIIKEIKEEEASDDLFVRFFEDVTGEKIEFNFKNVLSEISYLSASDEAEACMKIFPIFRRMTANSSVLSWLVNALKYTDELVLHYIQEILKIEPVKYLDHGKERSRYIQINKNDYRAHVAGSVLENLYAQRNKLEHRTEKDPITGKQVIYPPDFAKALKKIQSTFPKALQSFQKAYIEYYNK